MWLNKNATRLKSSLENVAMHFAIGSQMVSTKLLYTLYSHIKSNEGVTRREKQ